MEINNGDANTLPFIVEEAVVSTKDHMYILQEFYLLMSKMVEETGLSEEQVYVEIKDLMDMKFEYEYGIK